MATYLYDDYGLPFFKLKRPKNPPNGGYLSKKCAHIDLSKRVESLAGVLHGNCFQTTGFIVTRDICIEVSHMLFDSGASCSFISRRAAKSAGLTVHPCEPHRFSTGDQVVSHDKIVIFKLYIAGVKQKITAYIDDGPSANDHHILLGVPAMKQFDMQSNHCYGRKQETRWSVAQNMRGLRRKRYILSGDSLDGNSVMTVHDYGRGLRRAKRRGETSKERHAREVVERRRVKIKEAKARYREVMMGNDVGDGDDTQDPRHPGQNNQGKGNMKSGNRIMKPKPESKKSTAKMSIAKKAQLLQAEPKNSTATPPEPIKDDKPPPPVPRPQVSNCFYTTGYIIGDGNCVQVTHILIDSGASSSFINLRAVRKAKLTIYEGPSHWFSTLNGMVAWSKYVSFPLRIGGIQQTVSAFVEEREDDRRELLLGIGEMNAFRMTFHPPTLAEKEMRVSIKSDVKGQRNKPRYLQRDDPKVGPALRVLDTRKEAMGR
ncbi:hypothetical protein PRZ48_003527 [Zasmidium cellare]|uniref:Uncharacterized protein n=1 Tax=Zasmidium cellare TaxID=395010 RepID=A0ABR0EVB0_ZASCE|nr:hypothetical protein PRZ48_003527 [Zasmidium cellare]